MSETHRCTKCGALLTRDAREGVCPRCWLGQVLAEDPSATTPVPSALPRRPSPDPAPGDCLGHYKVLEQIGEGGCGVVYLAEQEEPVRRHVALKVIKLGMDTKEVVARFEAERQALALMDHVNIARVFDAGATPSGRPFFVMELVRGIRITDYCDGKQLSPGRRLELFMQVCQAVQHAHQKGIIHRDLKPSNILVTEKDGVAVPKVIDFGIAKATGPRLTDKTLFTKLHQLIGTPAYMSPEQADLAASDVDTRSDIYSLGVLLYELLTGSTPFDVEELIRAGFDEMLRIIREREPERPSARLTSVAGAQLSTLARHRHTAPLRLKHLLQGDLDWIVMKCLEKDRTRRYDTATSLVQDLARHLEHQPVLARPPSMLYRARRFARRNRVLVGSGAVVTASLVVALAVSLLQTAVARRARHAAQLQRQTAETHAARFQEQLTRIHVSNGNRALEGEDWFGALLWYTEALRRDQSDPRAEAMHRYRIGALLNYSPRLAQVFTHDGAIRHADFSPDGHWVLTASQDGTARLWEAATGRLGPVLRHDTNVTSAVFSSDGRHVLTLSDDATAHVWDAASGRRTCPPMKPGYRIQQALISPESRRVYMLGDPGQTNLAYEPARPRRDQDSEVSIWDPTTGKQVRPAFRVNPPVSSLVLSGDGRWLAAEWGDSVLVWDLHQPSAMQLSIGSKPFTMLPTTGPVSSEQTTEVLLPSPPASRASRMPGKHPQVNCVAFGPDNRALVAGYGDGSARVWRVPEGTSVVMAQPRELGKTTRPRGVSSARFSPDGQSVFLIDTDGDLRLWDARTGESLDQRGIPSGFDTWFSPDGRLAFLGGRVWDLQRGAALSQRLLHPTLTSAAFSPDGEMLLTAGTDGSARIWHLAGLMPIQPPLKHDWSLVKAQQPPSEAGESMNLRERMEQSMLEWFPNLGHAAFSLDGRLLATVSWNGSARVWDVATGMPILPFVTLEMPLEYVRFDREGSRFVTAGGNPPYQESGIARVWDARSGQPLTPLLKDSNQIRWADFTADGRWLVTQTDSAARVWDAKTGEPAEWLAHWNGVVRSLAFSPNAPMAVVCGIQHDDPTARDPLPSKPEETAVSRTRTTDDTGWRTQLWNMELGRMVTPFQGETNELTQLQFSPDGQWLLTLATPAYATVVARLWSVTTGQPVSEPVRTAGFWPQATFTTDNRHVVVLGVFGDPILMEVATGRLLDPGSWQGLKKHPQAITLDGQRVVTIKDGVVQVLDALTGDPLSPPLGREEKWMAFTVTLSPAGDALAVLSEDCAQVWSLPKDERSVEELALVSQLLSGRMLDGSGRDPVWSSAAAKRAWETLRTRNPGPFEVSRSQIRAWREHLVEQSEREEQWFSAEFHLARLMQDYPDEELLRQRHARARNQAALEQLK